MEAVEFLFDRERISICHNPHTSMYKCFVVFHILANCFGTDHKQS